MLLAGAVWLSAAHASTLYRCTGASGELVFSSSTAGYHECHKLGSFGAAPARHPPKASLTRVNGEAVTTAQHIGAGQQDRASLDAVQAGAMTSAQILDKPMARVDTNIAAQTEPVPAALRGHWTYHQSTGSDASLPAAPVAAAGDRVLRGAVYRVVQPDGSVEYTNLRPASTKGHAVTMLFTYIATCFACNLHSTVRWGSIALNLTAYADVIRSASLQYGVDEAFLRAIIHAESAFNPRAMSLKGAQGLMQLMPATANDMGVLDAFNSAENIRGGARYLSLLLHDFNGNEHLAAAAYNAGPGAVQRYNGVPPYAETQVYVQRVDTLRRRYEAALHPPLAANRTD